MAKRTIVLVVEDDPGIRRGLVDTLTYAGFDVRECADGTAAREMLLGAQLDLVLLDVMLPGPDGFELLAELRRARPRLPVILVTARGAEEDRVRGLRGGADDYVVKPFSSSELLARVEAVLRRSAERPLDVTGLRLGARHVSLERHEVRRDDGTTRTLSERDVALLRYLAGSPGRAIAREELLQRVWGVNPRGLETRTVDMQVLRLREKLGDRDGERFLETVHGKGYRLAADVEVEGG